VYLRLTKTSYTCSKNESDASKTNLPASGSQSNLKSGDSTYGLTPPYLPHLVEASANLDKYSACRINAFVSDRIYSQVQHRYSSVNASIQEHTDRIKISLDEFDIAMARE
jgi:hypothetical protein